jgi:NAD(P)-dependent dehydrogenase (short-subunit alcohol dehydrogenase family)
MTDYAVITGASTGIGRAAVKVLVGHGWHVFPAVRKPADADSLRQEFDDKVTPVLFDVTDEAAIKRAADEVRAKLGGQTLKGLVNNAGMGIGGPLMHIPVDDIRRVFEANLFGAVSVSQAFIPLLGADRSLTGSPGRIVNITSVGGRLAPPFIGDYVMSKHALEAFTDSLRRELMIYGIDVIAIGPGAVRTPIWDKAEKGDDTAYAKTDYAASLKRFKDWFIANGRKEGLPPERIGETIYTALSAAKPSARYAVLSKKLFNWTIPLLLPKRVVDKAIAKQLGLVRI